VSSAGSRSVLRYDGTTGAFLGAFVPSGSGGLNRPHGLLFGLDGNLYVNSADDDSVMRYDGTTGTPLPAPGQTAAIFVPPHSGGLRDNYGQMIFGLDGNLYDTSCATNNVLRFDGTTGAFLNVFVPAGSGGLTCSEGLVLGPDGNLYVVSTLTNSILRYDGTSGMFLGIFAGPGSPLMEPQHLTYWDMDAACPSSSLGGARPQPFRGAPPNALLGDLLLASSTARWTPSSGEALMSGMYLESNGMSTVNDLSGQNLVDVPPPGAPNTAQEPPMTPSIAAADGLVQALFDDGVTG
jgi:hypothetical protein